MENAKYKDIWLNLHQKATVQSECNQRLLLNAFSTTRNGETEERGKNTSAQLQRKTVEKEIGKEAKEHVQHNLHLLKMTFSSLLLEAYLVVVISTNLLQWVVWDSQKLLISQSIFHYFSQNHYFKTDNLHQKNYFPLITFILV